MVSVIKVTSSFPPRKVVSINFFPSSFSVNH